MAAFGQAAKKGSVKEIAAVFAKTFTRFSDSNHYLNLKQKQSRNCKEPWCDFRLSFNISSAVKTNFFQPR